MGIVLKVIHVLVRIHKTRIHPDTSISTDSGLLIWVSRQDNPRGVILESVQFILMLLFTRELYTDADIVCRFMVGKLNSERLQLLPRQ